MPPRFLHLAIIAAISFAILGLSACSTHSTQVLGQAYVAPSSLNLRGELNEKNSTVAVLKHGDRVSILDVRRRFVKVRAANGAEGWADSLQLLSPEQMEHVRQERQRALALPSEGSATVFEALNVHIDPSRTSPAFAQIPEGGSVAVLGHRLEPKTAAAVRPALLVDRSQPATRRPRRARQARNNAWLPPVPPPPNAPENWQELSAERIDGAESTADIKANRDKQAAVKKKAELTKPVVLEDWTLVRTKDNQCGWVLSRNLMMSIPDEVAQYAEGKRITSYFDLATVRDDLKGIKHDWLWTTSSTPESYDFDGWRVFLWNRRRHRYETSYRQHDIEGYFPVHVDPADANAPDRTFELITKDDDGRYRRRTYFFDGTRVHLSRVEPYQPGETGKPVKPNGLDTSKLQAKMPQPGWFRRQWTALRRRISRSD